MTLQSSLGRLRLDYGIFVRCTFILLVASTTLLFLYLNRVQPHYFIDEAFHVPQTLRYCAWNFTQWDRKITTLPGLYLVATAILAPFDLCNITYMRCLNLLGTFLNFCLIYNILKKNCKNQQNNWITLASSFNIILFPPLYFWCFFYYTDVMSVSMVLLMYLLHQQERTKMTTLVGLLAILVRQTNIVWLGFFAIEHTLNIFQRRMEQPVSPRLLNTWSHLGLITKQITCELRKGSLSFLEFILRLCHNLLPYITVCLVFVAFVVWNRGIVIGDRTAHVATVHICQIFYFSVFLTIFSWPYVITHWQSCLRFLRRYWLLASFIVALIITVVRFNTLVHPYVLADNRHYWFYVWNRLMGRYTTFRYSLIPIYCASFFAISRNINHLRFLTRINYAICVCAVLIPQLLVEPRYFILPYIIYRLNIKQPCPWQVSLEFLTALIINILQFCLFANKVFYWADQPYPQRISW